MKISAKKPLDKKSPNCDATVKGGPDPIYFILKSLSEKVGSDLERLLILNYAFFRWFEVDLEIYHFRVVPCRIRLFPTLISKIKWFGTKPPLKLWHKFSLINWALSFFILFRSRSSRKYIHGVKNSCGNNQEQSSWFCNIVPLLISVWKYFVTVHGYSYNSLWPYINGPELFVLSIWLNFPFSHPFCHPFCQIFCHFVCQIFRPLFSNSWETTISRYLNWWNGVETGRRNRCFCFQHSWCQWHLVTFWWHLKTWQQSRSL